MEKIHWKKNNNCCSLNDDVIGYLKYDVDENNRVKIVDLVVDKSLRARCGPSINFRTRSIRKNIVKY